MLLYLRSHLPGNARLSFCSKLSMDMDVLVMNVFLMVVKMSMQKIDFIQFIITPAIKAAGSLIISLLVT